MGQCKTCPNLFVDLSQSLEHGKISPRERNYLFLAGIFITSLTLANIVGVTKFVDLGKFIGIIPAGLFAYPITFLATDLISELYGRNRAQAVVWMGFLMNFLILFLMWVGHVFPDASGVSGAADTFESLYEFMKPNVVASMTAYLIAQSFDVSAFHFLKRVTKGKHLWLRNIASTTASQVIDTAAILSILYASGGLGDLIDSPTALLGLMWASYKFKFLFALADTPFCYLGVYMLKDTVGEDAKRG